MKYAYLILLWVFVLLAIALIRKDIFINKRLTSSATGGGNGAGASANASAGNSAQAPNSTGAQAPSANHLPSNQQSNTPSKLPTEIHIVSGIASGDHVMLDQFEVTIGRAETCTITLPDSLVSSNHAKIFFHQGQYFIEDLHSTNGTFVDGHQIKGVTSLSNSSRITIGKNVLELI